MAVMLPRLLGAVVGLAVAGMVTAAPAASGVEEGDETVPPEIVGYTDPLLKMVQLDRRKSSRKMNQIPNDELAQFLKLQALDPLNKPDVLNSLYDAYIKTKNAALTPSERKRQQALKERQEAQSSSSVWQVLGLIVQLLCGDAQPEQCAVMLKERCGENPAKECLEKLMKENIR